MTTWRQASWTWRLLALLGLPLGLAAVAGIPFCLHTHRVWFLTELYVYVDWCGPQLPGLLRSLGLFQLAFIGGAVLGLVSWVFMVRSGRLAWVWGTMWITLGLVFVADMVDTGLFESSGAFGRAILSNAGLWDSAIFAALIIVAPIVSQLWVASAARSLRVRRTQAGSERLPRWFTAFACFAAVPILAAGLLIAWGPVQTLDTEAWTYVVDGPMMIIPPREHNSCGRMLDDVLQKRLHMGMSARDVAALLGERITGGDSFASYRLLPTWPSLSHSLLALVRWGTPDPWLQLKFNGDIYEKKEREPGDIPWLGERDNLFWSTSAQLIDIRIVDELTAMWSFDYEGPAAPALGP